MIPYSVYNRLFGRGLLGALQIVYAILNNKLNSEEL